MKFKNLSLLIAIAISAQIAYTVYAYSLDSKKALSTIFALVSFTTYIGGLIGLRLEYDKGQTLKNTVSVLFIFLNVVATFVFLRANYSDPIYLLINVVLLLSYFGLVNFFSKAKF